MRRLACIAAVAAPLFAASPALAQDRTMAEVFATAATFCPRGTLPADGRELRINANQALFSLIGWTYGGDGRTTFMLPDLRGRSPVQVGRDLMGVEVLQGQLIDGAPAPQRDPPVAQLGGGLRQVDFQAGEAVEALGAGPDPALDIVPDPDMPATAGAGLGLLHCIVVEGIYPSRD